MKEMKAPRAISESSTTSDNTSEFIDIVKKYDVVYNTHNPDYKNVEIKLKVWAQIAEEINLSVEASKRKWKNLRDSYTKYLRSFRSGTKTSKKYQYWAHADHMEFLKPYQGPGRNTVNNGKSNDDDDIECDLGFQVLAKATANALDDDLKVSLANSVTSTAMAIAHNNSTTAALSQHATNAMNAAAISNLASVAASFMTPLSAASTTTLAPSMVSPGSNCAIAPISSFTNSNANCNSSASTVVLPLPALPAVPLSTTTSQFQQNAKQALASMANLPPATIPLPAVASNGTSQIFPLAPLNAGVAKAPAAIPMPASSNANNMGCLIIEPHLFAASDTFKKELNGSAATALGFIHNLTSQAAISSTISNASRNNPPLFTKIKRVQPSPQTAAINLSFTANNGGTTANQATPAKLRKISNERNADLDVTAVLQANRDLDANTLFFLSLARQVRAMPMKFQSLAKMRCMRIVSDIELELENVECNNAPPMEEGIGAANSKYCSIDTPPPPAQTHESTVPTTATMNEASTEHFVYVMSPSRVESMIDISSDEEANVNGVQ